VTPHRRDEATRTGPALGSVLLHAIGFAVAAFAVPGSLARVAWSGNDAAAIELSIAQPRGLEPVAAIPPIPLVTPEELAETADAALAEIVYELPPPQLPKVAGLLSPLPPPAEPPSMRPETLSLRAPPPAEAATDAALASAVDSAPRDAASVQASVIPGRNLPPRYPFVAWRRHIEGTVVVEMDIDASGRVTATRLASSSGCRMLDDAAVQQLATWEFEPARGPLGPVSCTMRQPVIFQIRT
jgi:protein TonB